MLNKRVKERLSEKVILELITTRTGSRYGWFVGNTRLQYEMEVGDRGRADHVRPYRLWKEVLILFLVQ